MDIQNCKLKRMSFKVHYEKSKETMNSLQIERVLKTCHGASRENLGCIRGA